MLQIAFTVATLVSSGSFVLADDVKPEMVVHFTKGGVACLQREHLQEITMHAIKGEATKADAMMLQNGGDCIMLSPAKRFKVLAVEYNIPDLDFGLLEIVGEDTVRLNGAWAFSVGAEQVQSNAGRRRK